MRKQLPTYITPPDFKCPECGEECEIIALDTSFDYGEGHHGAAGIHYPSDCGLPVTDCCEAEPDIDVETYDPH